MGHSTVNVQEKENFGYVARDRRWQIQYRVSQEALQMALQQSWHPSLVSLEHTCVISFF